MIYLPKNIFVVKFNNNLSDQILNQFKIVSINKILPEYKIDQKLKNRILPDWCLIDNFLHVKILLFSDVEYLSVKDKIITLTNSIIETNEESNFITISISPSKLSLLAQLNFISYICLLYTSPSPRDH